MHATDRKDCPCSQGIATVGIQLLSTGATSPKMGPIDQPCTEPIANNGVLAWGLACTSPRQLLARRDATHRNLANKVGCTQTPLCKVRISLLSA